LKNGGIFLVFPGPPSVKMLPDFVIFQSIRAIALRHGNSDHSFTYQGCFWAISGDLASITGGQMQRGGKILLDVAGSPTCLGIGI
jgi:hypothetical protein